MAGMASPSGQLPTPAADAVVSTAVSPQLAATDEGPGANLRKNAPIEDLPQWTQRAARGGSGAFFLKSEKRDWTNVGRGGGFYERQDRTEKKQWDSDDEEDDTVETRKSVKTAEKALKKRFFINAKEKRDYSQAINDGKISDKQINFEEDEDEELGPVDP